MYYTYGIGTRKNHKVYLLSEVKIPRVWTTDTNEALVFFSPEEARFVIDKFVVPNCSVAKIPHHT